MTLNSAPIDTSQTPFDVAVVIPTLLRETLLQSVRSVFAQDLNGRVQILIGVDIAQGELGMLDLLKSECPEHMHLTILNPGYSTSIRHGGLYSNRYSGALRTILSYLANSRYVAYLDDDNWWALEHLSTLIRVVPFAGWSYSRRWFVSPHTGEPLCIDEWESVGPQRGAFQPQGFVDTSSLMIDKIAFHDVTPNWAIGPGRNGGGEDRLVMAALTARSLCAPTGHPTSYYRIGEDDSMHFYRLHWLRGKGIKVFERGARLGNPLSNATIGLALAMKPERAKAAALRIGKDPVIEQMILNYTPNEFIVFGDAGIAVTLTGLALAADLTPLTLMAEVETPIPPVGANLIPHLAILPKELGDPITWLARADLQVDFIYFRSQTGLASATLIAIWASLAAGRIVIIDAEGVAEATMREAAIDIGAEPQAVSVAGRACWFLPKGR